VNRHFLFLQGMATPFFSRLADAMIAGGERASRVNFSGGDALYWRGKPAWRFAGEPEALPAFLGDLCARLGVTDFVLFCDAFPLHQRAIALAAERGIRVHVWEEGYVRPHWITLQRGGTHAAYRVPRDPRWFLEVSEAVPDPGEGRPLDASFARRALHDAAYHLGGLLNPLAYNGYRTHRPYVAPIEYAAWAYRYAQVPWWRPRDALRATRLIASRQPYFFFPLQLNADVQVARNSPFGSMHRAIEHVMQSFASHAPPQMLLAVKNHPFDTGIPRYGALVSQLAKNLDLSERVRYFETGDANRLVDHSVGVVTVNSTVGFTALQRAKPAKALGRAVYDLPRLSAQAPLDDFWRDPQPPDEAVCRAFRRVLVHATQVNGGFYTSRGIAMAIESWPRLLEPEGRLDRLLREHPAPAPGRQAEAVL
jgi:capsular polysaccharide export protein